MNEPFGVLAKGLSNPSDRTVGICTETWNSASVVTEERPLAPAVRRNADQFISIFRSPFIVRF